MDSMEVVEDVVEGNKLSEGSNWHGEESCGVCVCVGRRGGGRLLYIAVGFERYQKPNKCTIVCTLLVLT